MVKPGTSNQPEPEKPAETQKPGVSEPEKGDRKPTSGRRPQTGRPVQTQTLAYVQPVESEWVVRFRLNGNETMTGSFMALENPLEVKVQSSGTASKKTMAKASRAGSGTEKTKKKASGTGKQAEEAADSSLEATAESSKRLTGEAGDLSSERISHSGGQELSATEATVSADSNVRNWSLWLTAAGGITALLLGNRWRKKNR